ncbi:MAG TPA: glutathione S-transferase family protein [Steroidobacteraceae bacterium]|jgi:glutathione S-transferase
MLTLYDYLPSQNGYKIRLLLSHLRLPYRTELVSIFEGEGQHPEYKAINPTGAVPAIRLDDGRVLSESNAILTYLAEGTPYSSDDRYLRAKIQQWMSFEADYVQSTMGSLRYWVLTGKVPRRPPALIEMKRAGSIKALRILDEQLAERPFIVGEHYTIADISLFAYSHVAPDAGIPLDPYPNVRAWIERVRAQPGFVPEIYPYSIDPHSHEELP